MLNLISIAPAAPINGPRPLTTYFLPQFQACFKALLPTPIHDTLMIGPSPVSSLSSAAFAQRSHGAEASMSRTFNGLILAHFD